MKKILYGKKVFTFDKNASKHEAIAIEDKKIVGLGSLSDLKAKFPSFEVDSSYKENYIYPAWVEPHSHIIFSALFLSLFEYFDMLDWDLDDKQYKAILTREDFLKSMKNLFDSNPDQKEFRIYGLTPMVHGKIEQKDIEALTDKPVLIVTSSTHTWITANGMDKNLGLLDQPDSIFIGKDENGNRNGKYSEQAALPALKALIPIAMNNIDQGLGRIWHLSKKYGVSSMTEHAEGLIGVDIENTLMEKFVKEITKDNIRLIALPWLQNWFNETENETHEEVKAKIEQAEKTWNKENSPHFYYDKWIKVHLDGAIKDQEVKLSTNFNNRNSSGNWNYQSKKHNIDTLIDDLIPFWKDGYSLSFHTQGDGAHDKFIEIFETLTKISPKGDKMFRDEHLGFAPDRFFEKIKQFEEKPEVSGFSIYNNLYPEAFERTNVIPLEVRKNLSRFRSVIDAGSLLSLHSDIPNMPTNPLFVAWEAVTRETALGNVNNKTEAISREEALKAITINAATMTKIADVTGSLEVGKFADINIFNEDLFNCEINKWKDLPSITTFFEGKKIK